MEARPVARSLAVRTVDDEIFGPLSHFENVFEHAQQTFGPPSARADRWTAVRADRQRRWTVQIRGRKRRFVFEHTVLSPVDNPKARARYSAARPATSHEQGMNKALYILGQLSDQDVDWMLAVGHAKQVPPGTVLLREGEEADALYIVLHGTVSVSSRSSDGHAIASLSRGEVLGEI